MLDAFHVMRPGQAVVDVPRHRPLTLSHRAQPVGSARVETRRAGERTAPVRQRTSEAAVSRLEARVVELGFGGDLAGHLRDGYERRRMPVLALARELSVGNTRVQTELNAAGVHAHIGVARRHHPAHCAAGA